MKLGTMTTRSSPKRAMSPPMDLVNSYSSLTAFLTSSTLFFARGVTLRIRMFPDLSSRLMTSMSSRVRNGRAFK